jgi:hypothetical protein
LLFNQRSARIDWLRNPDAFLTELRVAKARAVDRVPEHARDREQEESQRVSAWITQAVGNGVANAEEKRGTNEAVNE